MAFLGIEWAPIKVPFQRRLQTGAVMFLCSQFLILPVLSVLLTIALLFTSWYWLSLAYGSWVIYDVALKQTSRREGRRWHWYRRFVIWRYFRDYFPISLIKTAELDASKNYICGYHPHGVLGFGALCNFGTEATEFTEKFPGLTPHLCTLPDNFRVPIFRGVILWMGLRDTSKESIQYVATKKGGGNIVILVVGGAKEALEARPDAYKLTLKNRKGFVRMAIKSGAGLVPVFSFGENDLFSQANNPEGSALRTFQEKFKKLFGFSPPIFYGRGVFNYTFGMIPYRQPVHTVVGRPIIVPQQDEPEPETVDKYHKLYMHELNNLFNEHKVKFGVSADKNIEFI